MTIENISCNTTAPATADTCTNQITDPYDIQKINELAQIVMNNWFDREPDHLITQRVQDYVDLHPNLNKYCFLNSPSHIALTVDEFQKTFTEMKERGELKDLFGLCLARNAEGVASDVVSVASSSVSTNSVLSGIMAFRTLAKLGYSIYECW